MIQVRIKASKTDPFRQGVSIYMGATGKQLCPVVAVLSYMVERGNSPGPLFQWQDGTYLTRDNFVHSLREALSLAGYPPEKFAGHSFRIGAATTAARCSIPESLIQTLGCWRISDISGPPLIPWNKCHQPYYPTCVLARPSTLLKSLCYYLIMQLYVCIINGTFAMLCISWIIVVA